MGWYRFVPRMECFHGVASLDHKINGTLIAHKDTFALNDAIGYIEKDWGKSMPSAWVWTQSNSFYNHSNTSFMLSVANIPWIGKSFTGFLGFFLFKDELYRFATYTNAKITKFEHDNDRIAITIKEKSFTITFSGNKGKRGELLAPKQGEMERKINESIDAKIVVSLFDKKGKLIFSDSSKVAGLELVGDITSLQNDK
jgi:tocopherol cyclase